MRNYRSVRAYRRPEQAQARQNSSTEQGDRHKVPPLAEEPLKIDTWRGSVSLFKDVTPERPLMLQLMDCIYAHTGSTKWTQWKKEQNEHMKFGRDGVGRDTEGIN